MPVTTAEITHVECDSPSCPGHPDLAPDSLDGWLLIAHEVYGEPTGRAVFGSVGCLATFSNALAADELEWPAPEMPLLAAPAAPAD